MDAPKTASARGLVEDLGNFRVREFTALFRADAEGRKICMGYFQDGKLAQAYSEACTGVPDEFEAQTVLMLSDGKIGFLLQSPITFEDEKALQFIRIAALRKLTPLERKYLGI